MHSIVHPQQHCAPGNNDFTHEENTVGADAGTYRTAQPCQTACTTTLRELDAVLGLTEDVPNCNDCTQTDAACDLASFLDDEMFDALFDSNDMDKLLEPVASPFAVPLCGHLAGAPCEPSLIEGSGEHQYELRSVKTSGACANVEEPTPSWQPCEVGSPIPAKQRAARVTFPNPSTTQFPAAQCSPQLKVRTQLPTLTHDPYAVQQSPASACSNCKVPFQQLYLQQQAGRMYQVQFGGQRRIRLMGTCLLNIKPMLTTLFRMTVASCANLPGTCPCLPGQSRCGCSLPPTVVAFDSPPLDQEQYEYIMATLQHRHMSLLDPNSDDLRPLPPRLPLPLGFQPRDSEGAPMVGPLVYTMGKTHNHGRLYFASFDPVHNTIKRFIWADGLDPFSEEARTRGQRAARRVVGPWGGPTTAPLSPLPVYGDWDVSHPLPTA